MIPTKLINTDDAPAAFLITATICGIEIKFLVDTGSAIDALNITTYQTLPNPPQLHTPFYPEVFAVDNSPTGTIGQFDALIQIYNGHAMTTLELPLHVMSCGNSQ